jgi:type II secretion system protein N
MKAFLKNAVRYAGYALFFVGALVVFVWLTLPLDAAKDLIVRKAADEHNLDVSIGDLSTWGLTGLEATGVVVTPRPTPEERVALEEARKAREAWQKSRKARQGAPAAPPPAPATEEGMPPEAAEAAEALAAAAPPSAPADDQPPPLPEGPQPVHVDELRFKVGLLDLLAGTHSGRLEAKMLGGALEGDYRRDGEKLDVDAKWSELDLRQLSALKSLLPLPIAGAFQGEVDVEVPVGDQGGLRLTAATGHIDLKVANGTIGPGRIESDKLGAFPYFDVPKARVDELGGRLAIEKKRATFENFKMSGKDMEGELTGYIQLADKFDRWAPRSHLRFKFSDEFLEKNKDVKVAMTSIGYLKRGQADGYTGFSITGTFQKPQFQPRKKSPYVTDSGRTVAAAGDDDKPEATKGRRPSSARLARDRAAEADDGEDDEAAAAVDPAPRAKPPIPSHRDEESNDAIRLRSGRSALGPPVVAPSAAEPEPAAEEPTPPPTPVFDPEPIEPPPPVDPPMPVEIDSAAGEQVEPPTLEGGEATGAGGGEEPTEEGEPTE